MAVPSVTGTCLGFVFVLATSTEYALVIDAGSSGSRLRIFSWSAGSKIVTQVDLGDNEDLFQTSPGLSSYASYPSEAGASLAGIVNAATTIVPSVSQPNTALHVMATAGMRLLPDYEATPILDDVRDFLDNGSHSPFLLGTVSILSGEEEALFGYVSINYNYYGDDSWVGTKGIGSLDLGGVSTQVLFVPADSVRCSQRFAQPALLFVRAEMAGAGTAANQRTLEAGRPRSQRVVTCNRPLNVCYHFLWRKFDDRLGYGQDEAISRYQKVLIKSSGNGGIVENPCYNRGYSANVTVNDRILTFNGTSNATACATLVRKILHLDYECVMEPCSAAGVYIPPVSGLPFFAYSAYFYAANGVGLVGWSESRDISFASLFKAGLSYCGLNISQALLISGQSLEYAKDYCFTSLYAATLLEAHGFSHSENITFTRIINGVSADWTLGAMYYELELLPLSASAFCSTSDGSRHGAFDGNDGDDANQALQRYKLAVVVLAILLAVTFVMLLLYQSIHSAFFPEYSRYSEQAQLPMIEMPQEQWSPESQYSHGSVV